MIKQILVSLLLFTYLLIGVYSLKSDTIVTTEAPVPISGYGHYAYASFNHIGYYWLEAGGTRGDDSVWIEMWYGEEDRLGFSTARRSGYVSGENSGGSARINGVHSNYFGFSLGGGLGYLELYDVDENLNIGGVIARAQISSYFRRVHQEIVYHPGTRDPVTVTGEFSIGGPPTPGSQEAIPEPATWLLSLLGLGAILCARRAKARSSASTSA